MNFTKLYFPHIYILYSLFTLHIALTFTNTKKNKWKLALYNSKSMFYDLDCTCSVFCSNNNLLSEQLQKSHLIPYSTEKKKKVH